MDQGYGDYHGSSGLGLDLPDADGGLRGYGLAPARDAALSLYALFLSVHLACVGGRRQVDQGQQAPPNLLEPVWAAIAVDAFRLVGQWNNYWFRVTALGARHPHAQDGGSLGTAHQFFSQRQDLFH